jgi:hypothetical protein
MTSLHSDAYFGMDGLCQSAGQLWYKDARLFSGITAFNKRHKTMEQKPEKKDKKRS